MTDYNSFNSDELKELLAKLAEEVGDMKVKDLLEAVNANKRMDTIEQEQKKITEHLDRFIGLLTYPEQVQDQINAINNQIQELWDAINTVELLKGVIELPVADGALKNELDFYTVKATGESGMSQSTLAKLAGVSRQAINKLEGVTKAPSIYLQSYTGQGSKGVTRMRSNQITYTIDSKNIGDLVLYKSDYCAAVITHYAMKGNKTALHYLANFCALGMTKWIHGITGWQQQSNY